MYCVYKLYFKERRYIIIKIYRYFIKNLKSCQPLYDNIEFSCSHTYNRDWSFN